MERKRLQTKLSGRFIWWQTINFEIIACSYLFILLLSSCIFWTKNKQKQRITWKQMHWFLAKQSSTNLKKNLINMHMHKLSFCYFYHDEIYLLHENFYEFHWKFYIKLKACVRYFSLFLKQKCISSLFRMKYIVKKFNLQLLFLPVVSCLPS